MQLGYKVYGSLIAILILLVGGVYLLTRSPEQEPIVVEEIPEPAVEEPVLVQEAIIGQSVAGRDISVTTIGTGETTLLFVGGIHGGYEWNTALLAYEMIDHFTADPSLVPETITLAIVPDLNPDGTFLRSGVEGRFAATDISEPTVRETEGRFNQNGIDLNRNFDCKWEPESTWRGEVRSAGTAAFSEPEAAAIRDWIVANEPATAVFWHSIGNGVFSSACLEGELPATIELMNTYAEASGYPAEGLWTAYEITGDAEGWLATLGIPAVTVEFKTPNSIEWQQNLAGVEAIMNLYK